jgi:hypothetical protein
MDKDALWDGNIDTIMMYNVNSMIFRDLLNRSIHCLKLCEMARTLDLVDHSRLSGTRDQLRLFL